MLSIIKNSFRKLAEVYQVKKDPVAYARSLGVKVGYDVRLIGVVPGAGTFGSEPYLVEIGNHVTVTGGVRFVTHDGGVWVFRHQEPDIDVFGPIKIGNNVFIGFGALILPNVTIGDNVVIGARSVVSRDIPSNCVAAGAPAKMLKPLDDYYQSISSKKDNIRDYPEHERRRYLLEKFGIE